MPSPIDRLQAEDPLIADLERALAPDRVLHREIDRIAWANDASVYRLVPRAVARPRSVEEVRRLFEVSQRHRVPMTFRTAGTSLSGQAVTDGVLVDVARHFRRIEVLEGGRLVRVEPGAIGGAVNRHLAAHGRKIGPDPASIDSCMMGGILSNNSSGMCCGVEHNAYHTLRSIRFLLPSGIEIDTASPDADRRLAAEAGEVWEGIARLRDRVRASAALSELVRRKYRLKNTNGYSLNAFLDHDRPVDVLAHLLIGAEGTLAFIASAVLRTIPDLPHKSAGLLFFADVGAACAAIAPLRSAGAAALELMDRASLRAMVGRPGAPPILEALPDGAAAILVEYQCATERELAGREAAHAALVDTLDVLDRTDPARETAERATLWSLRRGLIPAVGAFRRPGTSFILEDVVFPPERLAAGVIELQELFDRHGYDDAILFGHARDGNLHFVLTQRFESAGELRRYDRFMRDLAELVAVRHGGALKAEHGTGRNMAPFVATEWGDEALAILREIKRTVDPTGLLNPGVILDDDPRAHVRHLKDLPRVEDEVDRCIECGFCERHCPSRDLTLTPRQRIVVRREMARLRARDPSSPRLAALERDWIRDGLDTCAADGVCATACPVGIDTGRLVKRLRAERRADTSQELALLAAEHFALVQRAARTALRVAGSLRSVSSPGGAGRPPLPAPGPSRLPSTSRSAARLVYFPSCVTRLIDDPERPIARAVVEVARRAGAEPWIPDDVHTHCCGLAFASRGFERAARRAAERALAALDRWSEGGRLPVVVDTSPCAAMLEQARVESGREGITLQDGADWLHAHLDRLPLRRLREPVALHPVCSVVRSRRSEALGEVARACAETVELAPSAGCCGFAGDRGFFVPELTAAATRIEAAELAKRPWSVGYSTSRTCELGLARATGRPWRSIWHLVEEATSSASSGSGRRPGCRHTARGARASAVDDA